MARKPRSTGGRTRSDTPDDTDTSGQEYRVGPGRPPKEFQFKPGQSGNPRGASRKAVSIGPDLKALFQRALGKKVKLRQGEKERILTMAAAGIEQLVNQFAKGDRHARRDLFDLAEKLGVDLMAGQGKALQQALEAGVTANDEALAADYVRRMAGRPDHQSKDSENPGGVATSTRLARKPRQERENR